MAKPRRVGVLVLLALVTCGALADRWILARRTMLPAAGVPSFGAAVVSGPVPSTPLWVCNRPVPMSKVVTAGVAMSGESLAVGPVPGRATRSLPAIGWAGDRLIADRTAEGYVIFVDFAPSIPLPASAWPREKLLGLRGFYNRAVLSYYAGARGFGDLTTWADAFGISPVDPIVLLYNPHHSQDPQPTATWHAGQVPVITYGPTIRTRTASHGLRLAVHELAHVWDGAHGWTLSEGLARVVQNPRNYPTARARDGGPLEDFAESVTAYLIDGYACNERWSDDDPRFYRRFGVQPDEVWAFDRHDYVARLFAGATMVEIREEADGLRLPDVVIAEDDRVMPER